jgi:hypothetical protein
MKPKLISPNEKEFKWIKTQLESDKVIIEKYSPDDAEKEITLSILDKAFRTWMSTSPTDITQINEVINAIGITLGQKMVDNLGLNWVIASDPYGTELAVYGFPKEGEFLIYPANLIAKRWERKEINFIEKTYKDIEQQIHKVRKTISLQ